MLVSIAISAAVLPALLAYNVSPSPTFLNQAMALLLWGGLVAYLAPSAPTLRSSRDTSSLQFVLLLAGGAAAVSWMSGRLPGSLALSAIGSLSAAAVMVAGGASACASAARQDVFPAFCWAWLIAGLLNTALGAVQVFLPDLPDGTFIAHSGIPGRAVGNLRQPNHLSSLLVWSCVVTVALLELGRLRRGWAACCGAALVFAIVLTASRTGLLSVVVLAAWGAFDRRLSRPARPDSAPFPGVRSRAGRRLPTVRLRDGRGARPGRNGRQHR